MNTESKESFNAGAIVEVLFKSRMMGSILFESILNKFASSSDDNFSAIINSLYAEASGNNRKIVVFTSNKGKRTIHSEIPDFSEIASAPESPIKASDIEQKDDGTIINKITGKDITKYAKLYDAVDTIHTLNSKRIGYVWSGNITKYAQTAMDGMNARIEMLRGQVIFILAESEDTRNSDEVLTVKLIEKFYPAVIQKSASGELCIPVKFLGSRTIPSHSDISRLRRLVQNTKRLFLPTDPEVRDKRRISEQAWIEYIKGVS